MTKNVVAAFISGTITSDVGTLLLGQQNRGLGLIRCIAGCFTDRWDPMLIEQPVETIIGHCDFELALGYDNLNDHDESRHDPVFAVQADKYEAKCSDCTPVADKRTFSRLGHTSKRNAEMYHKIDYDVAAWKCCSLTSSSILTSGHHLRRKKRRGRYQCIIDLGGKPNWGCREMC